MVQNIDSENVIQVVNFGGNAPEEGFLTLYSGLYGFSQTKEVIKEVVVGCVSGGSESVLRQVDPDTAPPEDVRLRFHRIFEGNALYSEEDKLCPHCGCVGVKHSHPVITLQHLPVAGDRTFLQVRQTRFLCPHCKKTFQPLLPFQTQGHRLTEQLKLYIEDLCAAGFTLVEISLLTGVDRHIVGAIDTKRLKAKYTVDGVTLIKPERQAMALGIDEFKLHNGHKYATHIIDLETGHILWIAQGKKKQVVYDFINHVGLEWMANVKVVACDMNADFSSAFQEKCPHLEIVFDRFHIIHNFNNKVVSEVRKDEYKRLLDAGEVDAARSMKRCKYILSACRSTLRKQDQEAAAGQLARQGSKLFGLPDIKRAGDKEAKYDKLLQDNELFFMLDYVKEALAAAYAQTDRAVMEADILEIIGVCKATGNKHFEWFARLLETHMDGITAHALYPFSNGKIEGINGKIKVTRRKSYGFRSDEYFFLKLMDMSRRAKG